MFTIIGLYIRRAFYTLMMAWNLHRFQKFKRELEGMIDSLAPADALECLDKLESQLVESKKFVQLEKEPMMEDVRNWILVKRSKLRWELYKNG